MNSKKSSILELEEKETTLFHKAHIAGSALQKHEQTTRNSNSHNKKQIHILKNKLNMLICSSKWFKVSRKNLISNLSGSELSDTQLETLSFGLKFPTGLLKNDTTDFIMKNHHHNNSDFTKGYIQGLITAIYKKNKQHFLHRYIKVLKELANKNIHIAPSDKGGRIVIMDELLCQQKMRDLINNNNIYEKVNENRAIKETQKFISNIKKLLQKNEDSSGMKLIEHHLKHPHYTDYQKHINLTYQWDLSSQGWAAPHINWLAH